ncbi:MAG: site-specific integrase [Candidatus Hydrogenedentes bacterium]|nr:site-specific integrase [Candidatus Hydrogenedentota bacterium]
MLLVLHFLLQSCGMNPVETGSKASRASVPRPSYLPVFDGRKRRVRGLWQRNGTFVARLTTETPDGRKKLVWHVLKDAQSVSEARQAMADLETQRRQSVLVTRGEAPRFADFVARYTAGPMATKRSSTQAKETTHLTWWQQRLGALRLDQIRRSHVLAGLEDLEKGNAAARTRNLYAITLRNCFKYAMGLGHLGASPADGITWLKPEGKKRDLVEAETFERLLRAAASPSFHRSRLARSGEAPAPLKNAEQFADYLRFLLYTGAREKEALRVRWKDVDFDRQLVAIGADGQAKNAEVRHVDFNSALSALLTAMKTRRAPDSQWLFPSPQRGERDLHAKTFRESLKLSRGAIGMPTLGFHDTRHAFISRAVMAGIDFMTIARWVGHKDGGVLIGKVYGHIANEHRQKMAARLQLAVAAWPHEGTNSQVPRAAGESPTAG